MSTFLTILCQHFRRFCVNISSDSDDCVGATVKVTRCLPPARWPSSDLICPIFSNKWLYLDISRILQIHDQGNSDILLSVQCTKIILPTFDNWREWLILLQSTRMVDSGICIDKIGWFYPNRESTFWTMHAILELHIPILAMRNNKMGHRINKMWTLINKVGHRNVKLVDTYQQLVFKKQQNGSRVLYPFLRDLAWLRKLFTWPREETNLRPKLFRFWLWSEVTQECWGDNWVGSPVPTLAI